MKEQELRERAQCICCGKGIGACGIPLFWIAKIERHAFSLKAMEEQQALGQYLGHGGLAMAMGSNEDMTEKITEVNITICDACSTKPICLAELAERATELIQEKP